ncbi:MAG: hypothetical protein AAF612_09620 [Planctomycetota bacterium]
MPRPLLETYTLPTDLRTRVEDELRDDEELLWLAQPRAKRAALKSLPLTLFAIPWTGFAVFWTLSVAGYLGGVGHSNPPVAMLLFGLIFVGVGLLMLTGPIWAYRHALRTVYLVTDLRAALLTTGVRSTTRNFPGERLRVIKRNHRSDGSGDLILDAEAWTDTDGHRQTKHIGFFHIADVREVERLIEDVIKANASNG